MKYLRFLYIIVILLAFLASWSTFPIDKKKNTPKKHTSITPAAHAAPIIHNAPVNPDIKDIEKIFGPVEKIPKIGPVPQADKNYLRKYTAEFIAMAALFLILLFYWLQWINLQRRKQFKLDNDELALLGLAVDALMDLRRRLQEKVKSKIIPFPRGNE